MKHSKLLPLSFLLIIITACSPASYSSGMTYEDAGLKCANATITLKNHSKYDVWVTVDGLLYSVRSRKKMKSLTPASKSSKDKKKVCVNGVCEDLVLLPCYAYDFSAETW